MCIESRVFKLALVVTAFLQLSFEDANEKVRLGYYKAVQCNMSEQYFYPNFSCYAKSYSRTVPTLNIIAEAKKPIYEMFIEIIVFHKYTTTYRKFFAIPKFEWCSTWKEQRRNALFANYMNFLQKSAPSLVHDCFYKRIYEVNASADVSTIGKVFPVGDYRFLYNITDKFGASILNLHVIASITETRTRHT